MSVKNFYISAIIPAVGEESFETIFQGSTFRVERIVSNGHEDEAGSWYDQDNDEWVMLVSGEAVLVYEGGEEVSLKGGDYLFIPAHKRHRVLWTSSVPPCYWLAVHQV